VVQNAVQNPGLQQGGFKEAPAAEAEKQSAFNTLEMNRRAQVYTKNAEDKNYLQSVPPPSSSAPPGLKAMEEKASKPETVKPSPAKPALPQQKAQPQPQIAAVRAESLTADSAATPASQAGQVNDIGSQSVPAGAPQQRVTPFRPFWLENELFLVREVAESGKRHVQGVWLDAVSLKASLLESIVDILPQAALQAVASITFRPWSGNQFISAPSLAAGDPMDLVGLPWKLVPGEKPVAVIHGWTPMRLTLVAAWLGAALAALAAAALLFGVTRLSERRAAFVSSVTHELRTPLTTFRLYSELLEQGMVREEADRTQYLHTLRSEAERLTHLVDNVLAYSRIERTNRRSRMERLELLPWFDRIRSRLEDRAREADMKLDVSLPPGADELASVTDATALEQIVFNLVDNACKYAGGRCAEPVVRVSLERRGRWAELRVCDSGPGIARGERSRMFRPFHKSADEAANSKPGVGLGLALCHRLARALGGKLTLEKPDGQTAGACFVLKLPMA
jgi:signal transduction histidine kinase